ncbi:hypothetical protein [Bacillus sp. FJAT-45350]|uniref:hypothetical protein n=1 Tax=Bacillus sp. FJAT-45350 TaxID=2011014 RepID=UPI000BB74BE9|nr:hypothetical protein [Bacillus sp. FJAT-45350]
MYRMKSFMIIFSFVAVLLHLHHENSHFTSGHMHVGYEIPEEVVVPVIDGEIRQNDKGMWFIMLNTKHFTFMPEKVGHEDIDYHEGHAHLYINNQKVDSVFGNYYSLGRLEEGTYDIKVSLNTHNHRPFIYNGNEIAFTESIEVKTTR